VRFLLALLGSSFALSGVASAQVTPAAGVDELVVTSRVQRLYRTEATTIGKQAEDPLLIPQALQVLNAELIADLGARDVTDLYRNISGLSFFSYAGVTFRGFRQEQAFYDGIRGNPFIGFSVPQLFNIERVEVLKGPAGMLYGPGSPGGTINYVTKKPSDIFSGKVTVVGGNYDRYGASGEVEGPFDSQGRFTYRAGAFYENRDSFRVNAGSESFIGDLGLGIALTDRLDVTLQATAYDQDLPGNRLRGVQVDLAGNFLTDISWNHNEPTDYLKLKSHVFQARADWRIADTVKADATLRYFKSEEQQQYHEQRDLLDTDRNGVVDTITREFRDQQRNFDGLAAGANLSVDLRTGSVNHRILVGGDWYEQDDLSLGRTAVDPTRRGPVPNLSLANPVYGLTSGANYNLAAIPWNRSRSSSTRSGVYVQDQIALNDQWIVLGGVRHDKFLDKNPITGLRFDDSQLTYRAGLVYRPTQEVSLYGSWSDTFEPQSAGSQDVAVGGPFDPTTGAQVEAGVKTAMFGGRMQGGAAVYRIVRQNILQTDTTRPPVNGRNQLAPIGEITSKGFELDLSADITPAWVAMVNYGYNDTRVTGTVPGQAITNALGDRFVNAPKHKIGLWTRYQVDAIRTAFAIGAEHVSERVGFDRERVRPYTVFDASIIKTFDFAEVMLRVDNLFDKEYAASGFGLRNGSFPGEPRTWFVEVRRSF
jgi:iron complex outermembrane receptor protein